MVGMRILVILACTAFLANALAIDNQDQIYECGEGVSSRYIYANPSETPIFIASNNYGNGNYDNNVNCTAILETGSQAVIVNITAIHFELEYGSESCPWDYTCTGGDKSCGSKPTGAWKAYRVPSYSFFTLSFVTDFSVTLSGFNVSINVSVDSNDSSEGYEDKCATGNFNSYQTTDYGYVSVSDGFETPTPYWGGDFNTESSDWWWYNRETEIPDSSCDDNDETPVSETPDWSSWWDYTGETPNWESVSETPDWESVSGTPDWESVSETPDWESVSETPSV